MAFPQVWLYSSPYVSGTSEIFLFLFLSFLSLLFQLWYNVVDYANYCQLLSASASRVGHYGAIQMLYYYYYYTINISLSNQHHNKHWPLASADEYNLLHATVGLKGSDMRYPLACNINTICCRYLGQNNVKCYFSVQELIIWLNKRWSN